MWCGRIVRLTTIIKEWCLTVKKKKLLFLAHVQDWMIVWLVLHIWQAYFLIDRIVFWWLWTNEDTVMLVIRNFNLVIVQSWTYLFPSAGIIVQRQVLSQFDRFQLITSGVSVSRFKQFAFLPDILIVYKKIPCMAYSWGHLVHNDMATSMVLHCAALQAQ